MAPATDYAGLVRMIAYALVRKPECITILPTSLESSHTIRLTVDPSDMGQCIGKQGRTVKSIRTILLGAAMRDRTRVHLEIS
jgi:predicted RNA-binding protein YlqC (UPF0109 family)